MQRRWVACLAGVVLTTALVGCTSHDDAPAADGTPTSAPTTKTTTTHPVIDVSLADCGSTWQPRSGLQTVALHNAGTAPGEVRLLERAGPDPGGVLLDVEPFGPGTTVTQRVRLGAGKYSLECVMEDAPIAVGPTVTVTGSAEGGPAVAPVSEERMAGPARAYTRWVAAQLPALREQVLTLQSAIERHDVDSAQSAWLLAHAGYERLGAAYDAFGDLDAAIDGVPDGAFHVLEAGLWGRPDWGRLAHAATGLAQDVAALRHRLRRSPVDGLTISIRAHEISENLLQTTLTGHDDLGSHSALATLAAGLAGTREVLGLVAPILATRYAKLPTLRELLSSEQGLVERLGRSDLAGRAVADWPLRVRELVAARLSQLTEQLAPVAAVLEPRRTS